MICREPLLTPMMREILARHASGSNLSETARELHISVSAAHNYMAVIKRRLGARTIAGCVLKAHCLGYLTEPDRSGRVRQAVPDGFADSGRQAVRMASLAAGA